MINHLIESVHLDNAAHDISQNVKCVSVVEIPEAAHTDDHTVRIMTPVMILILMSNMRYAGQVDAMVDAMVGYAIDQ